MNLSLVQHEGMRVHGKQRDLFVLTSWKEIAFYLGKGVRTVQRWERHLGLPVRRPLGGANKRIVLARCDDLDAWIALRWSENGNRRQTSTATPALNVPAVSARHAALRLSHELLGANHALLMQLQESLKKLTAELGVSAQLTVVAGVPENRRKRR